MEKHTYTVVYRTGGTENFQWHRTVSFTTREEAQQCADDTQRMGYKALVHKTESLDVIGMPEGWEA